MMKKDNFEVRKFAWILLVVSFLLGLLIHVIEYKGINFIRLLGDLSPNIMSGAIEIAITVLILDTLAQKRAENQRKEEFIRQLGSSDKALSQQAAKEIKVNGWHNDGSLRGRNFIGANWENIQLSGADLTDSTISAAYLFNANLDRTNLSGVRLNDSFMREAKLSNAIYNEDTVLPDLKNWTPSTDMKKYTDPKHPNFWDPNTIISPRLQKTSWRRRYTKK